MVYESSQVLFVDLDLGFVLAPQLAYELVEGRIALPAQDDGPGSGRDLVEGSGASSKGRLDDPEYRVVAVCWRPTGGHDLVGGQLQFDGTQQVARRGSPGGVEQDLVPFSLIPVEVEPAAV